MTVQQRFRRQRIESVAGLDARRPSTSLPVARRVGLAQSLVSIGVVAALVTVAVWASTPTMAVAVAAIGIGVTAWGWLRAQKRKRWDLAYDELVRLWRPLTTSAALPRVLPSPRTFAALLAPAAGLTQAGRARRRKGRATGVVHRPDLRAGSGAGGRQRRGQVPAGRGAGHGAAERMDGRGRPPGEDGTGRCGRGGRRRPEAGAGRGRRRGRRTRCRHPRGGPSGRRRAEPGAGADAGRGTPTRSAPCSTNRRTPGRGSPRRCA